MTDIQNVIVAGANGKALGPAVVKALVSAGFTVSILSRCVSQPPVAHPDSVTVITTDYTPVSLKSALQGQDAVVSCVGFPGLLSQLTLIDEAKATGVQRFIPSEFGGDTRKGGLEELERSMSAKMKILDHVQAVAKESKTFSWTALATGPFLDYNLSQDAFGFSLSAHTARIYDSGNETGTGTLLADIARCVVGILQRPIETRNKYLCVRSVLFTQNAILSALEAHTHEKWTVTNAKTADVLESGRDKLKKGDRSCYRDILAVQFFEDGCGRGIVARSAEEGEEGMKILQPEAVELETIIKSVLA